MHKPQAMPDQHGPATLLQRENLESITGNSHTYGGDDEAKAAFRKKRELMLDINHWDALGPPDPARNLFILHDAAGNRIIRKPAVGDFVEIRLAPSPGIPGHAAGAPDWVRIEEILDEEDHVELTVRPGPNPKDPEHPEVIQHFFSKATTNTFKLQRMGAMLIAVVHGQHEFANSDTKDAGGVLKAARNRVVAETGWGVGKAQPGVGSPDQKLVSPQIGGQKGIWATFTRSLVEPEGTRSR